MIASTTISSELPQVRLLDGCRKLRVLGQGGFGTVDEVEHEDGQTYALKTVQPGPSEVRKHMAKMEGHYSRYLSHENLVKVHEVEVDQDQKETRILMEKCEGGDLRTLLSMYQDTDTKIPLDKAWSYFIQIAKALLYLHTPEKGDSVIQCALGHGDVKPENMLLVDEEQDVIKLGDFGLMKRYSKGLFNHTRAGSPAYLAPEVWLQGPSDYRADCYSLGLVAYELLNGEHPFAGESEPELMERHARDLWYEAPDYSRDGDLATLIDALMHPNPADRMTMAELFEHRAFKEHTLRHELAVRDRAIAKLDAQVALQQAQNDMQNQKIMAQALIIGSLKKRLAQSPAHEASVIQVRRDTSSASASISARSPPCDDDTLVTPIVEDDIVSSKAAPPSRPKTGASISSAWSWISSQDFTYSIDVSVRSASRLSIFDESTSSTQTRHGRVQSPIDTSSSACIIHKCPDRPRENTTASSREAPRDFPAATWLLALQTSVQLQDICTFRQRPKYKWRASSRRPVLERRRILEDFLRHQVVP